MRRRWRLRVLVLIIVVIFPSAVLARRLIGAIGAVCPRRDPGPEGIRKIAGSDVSKCGTVGSSVPGVRDWVHKKGRVDRWLVVGGTCKEAAMVVVMVVAVAVIVSDGQRRPYCVELTLPPAGNHRRRGSHGAAPSLAGERVPIGMLPPTRTVPPAPKLPRPGSAAVSILKSQCEDPNPPGSCEVAEAWPYGGMGPYQLSLTVRKSCVDVRTSSTPCEPGLSTHGRGDCTA